MTASTALPAWFREECAAMDRRPRTHGSLVLGGMVHGSRYVEMFADYGLSSILGAENCEALRSCGATIVWYTDAESWPRVDAIMRRAADRGIRSVVRMMPDAVMEGDRPFLRLAVAQQLLLRDAVRNGKAFHMLMPDESYSARFFPNLLRLSHAHGNIVQGSAKASTTALEEIDRHRRPDGTIAISARALGDIGWRHTVFCPMNQATADRWPNEHYHYWRARERTMMFNPYPNPSYIRPEVAHPLGMHPEPTTGTMDCHTQWLFAGDFYAPQVPDDMAFLGMSSPTERRVDTFHDRDAFFDRCWREIGGKLERMAHYTRPTEVPASVDDSAPDASDVLQRQRDIVVELIERQRKGRAT